MPNHTIKFFLNQILIKKVKYFNKSMQLLKKRIKMALFNKRSYVICLLLISHTLFASSSTVRRANAYLKLAEYEMGIKEVEGALYNSASDPELYEIYIKLLAASGKEIEAIQSYNHYETSFVSEVQKRELLEDLSWGIIRKGFNSSLILAKIFALVSATMTQDAYSVPLIELALEDSNWIIRKVAINLASYLMDRHLNQKILQLAQKDSSVEVRLEAIQAVASMKIFEAETVLNNLLINSNHLDAIEQAAILQAIIAIHEKASCVEIESLSNSQRAAMRQLSAYFIIESASVESLNTLFKLIKDSHPDVKIAALSALCLLKNEEGYDSLLVIKETTPLLKDMDYKVAITATYLHLLLNQEEAKSSMIKWCLHSNKEIRRFAGGALACGGTMAKEAMNTVLIASEDPFVRVPISVSLLGLRENIHLASASIFIFLKNEKANIMWEESSHPLFKTLKTSTIRRSKEEAVNTPEGVDMQTRLELLRLLAIFEYPQTKEILRQFLRERSFGVTFTAASTLVEEGGGEDMDLIKGLLADKDLKVQVQAAFVLAMVTKDKEAIDVLQKAYPKVDRELKIKILEALANIGDKESVPFLIDKMQDPYQVIRIIAAGALIICLNH